MDYDLYNLTPSCIPDTICYAKDLNRNIQRGYKSLCVDKLKSYISETPDYYNTSWYADRLKVAIQILKEVEDDDFKNIATDALNYILLDDFHENIKYGEKHLTYRHDLAGTLFSISIMAIGEGINPNMQKVIRDIGAKAYFHYALDQDLTIKERAAFASELSKYADYKDMCLEAAKVIIKELNAFQSIFSFCDYYTNLRETDNIESFSYILSSIAKDTSIPMVWRDWASKELISYREDHVKDFDQCHRNKVCIKEMTDSLNCLDKWIKDLNPLVGCTASTNEAID